MHALDHHARLPNARFLGQFAAEGRPLLRVVEQAQRILCCLEWGRDGGVDGAR